MIDRRTFLTGLTAALVFPRMAVSQLSDSLSLVTGVGTNVLALSTSDFMILVDSGAPQFGAQLMKSTRLVPTTVFNTHFHLENTGSNEALSQAGAKILTEPEDKPWHLREFRVADLDGNQLRVFYDFAWELRRDGLLASST